MSSFYNGNVYNVEFSYPLYIMCFNKCQKNQFNLKT